MYESTSAECPDVNRLAVRMWSAYAILSKIGKVAGYVKIFNVEDNITSDIKNEFSNELKAAKGIWVEFEILPSTSLFIVNDIMGFINDNCDENCEAGRIMAERRKPPAAAGASLFALAARFTANPAMLDVRGVQLAFFGAQPAGRFAQFAQR